MKGLPKLNSVLFLLVSSTYIGYYFIEYPVLFNLFQLLREPEWSQFILAYATMITGSALLGSLPIKEIKFKDKAFTSFAVLQSTFLIFILFGTIDTYWTNKKEFDYLVSEYKKKADLDIKSGLIVIEHAGGLQIPISENEYRMEKEIDSLIKTFGLTYLSGCIISYPLMRAQEEYKRFTKPYLDKRNGPNWEIKMKEQINQIRGKYR